MSTVRLSVDQECPTLGIIELIRPEKFNSFIHAQYGDISEALEKFENDDSISVVILTGTGKYYSSGNDLSEQSTSMAINSDDLEKKIKESIETAASRLVKAMINFKKPLIIGVNGPAVGIAVTSLLLADIVYSTKSATFNTPFMRFGFCAEGCSSLLFPMVMGISKANELLLLGKMMSSEEAKQCGFIADYFEDDQFKSELLKRARTMAGFPPNALKQTKALVRDRIKSALLDANEKELTLLVERFMSDECVNAIMQFMMEQRAKKQRAKL